jgi:hypothetical protein
VKGQDFHIIPYSQEYHDRALQLEKAIIQGNNIQLEIVKDHFLDRAKVFNKNYACIALTNEGRVIGSAIGARTMLTINGQDLPAGIGFDTKVDAAWRSKGVGRMLAKDLYKQFFRPQVLSRNFMTAKLSNVPVLKLVSHTVSNTSLYDFVYLTIPTTSRIKKTNLNDTTARFGIKLFNIDGLADDYYTQLDSGLGCFHTHKMYRLKIRKIGWTYKHGIAVMKRLQPSKYTSLPGENEMLSFATLYNHTAKNINGINEVLEMLETKGIKQLLVCCRKNDVINQLLQSIAIHRYSYWLVTDFKLDRNDDVSIDVRCL